MYRAIVATRIDRQALELAGVSRDRILTYSARLQDLAASTADRYGSAGQQPLSDGFLFLFENADAAVQFGLRLITSWREPVAGRTESAAHIPLRVGCHFGDCARLADGGAWSGQAIDIAGRIADAADPDVVYASGTVLDLVDTPLYRYEPAGEYPIEGDRVRERGLFRVLEHRADVYSARSPEEMTADDWLLKAAALAGTPEENSDTEVACYREALRLNPGLPAAHNNLAVILSARGDLSAATGHYQSAIGLRADYPEAHYNYAVLLDRRGTLSGASEHFRSALESRPKYADAHYAYANLLYRTDRAEDAESHYREALRLRPGHREAHNNLAILLEDVAKIEEAAEHYRAALQIEPGHPETHYNYALLLEKDGDVAAAEANYRAALALRPDYAEAHNNLAILLQLAGNPEAALTHYAETLRLRPDDPEAHYNYGLLLKRAGDPDAEEHFKLARDLAPDSWSQLSGRRAMPEDVAGGVDLTRREMDVIRLIAVGRSNRDIATQLSISPSTVAHHVTNILDKTGAENRTQAAAFAARAGLVPR